MTELNGVPYPPSVVVSGRRWNLYSADYTTPDGKYSFHFYALSDEHAAYILEDIKSTAVLAGQVCGIHPTGGSDD